MTKEEYFELTKKIPEIENLLKERIELKSKINKVNRRLISLSKKYKFLGMVVYPQANDDLLEENVKLLFKEIGFEKVHKVGKQLKREDLRIILSDKIILVEVTGTVNQNSSDDKTRQMTKHVDVEKSKGKNCQGMFVVNHENNKHFKEKTKTPFTKNQIKYAKAGKYTLMTTQSLVNAFMLVKTKKLSLSDFEKRICEYGVVEF
ncbi:hypothetical protein [Flagellimonas allohymeniacidonis]|uniref:Restriction endonuclease n=1 Tax=Flagellimonas allohymeniacidonis TaxID=2517819 RepID=A0A4Q8QE22_9FLAO|nr:hypothetical protein [Allomuricauda hymeniacidonis]TAI47837.1 hypothetical protein EW142_14375 [Allomuricauda hymeniacidonis]